MLVLHIQILLTLEINNLTTGMKYSMNVFNLIKKKYWNEFDKYKFIIFVKTYSLPLVYSCSPFANVDKDNNV